MAVDVTVFPYLQDNYGFLLVDSDAPAMACVDAGEARAVLEAVEASGRVLDQLWITHHHFDHTDGLAEVKDATGCEVIGPAGIDGVDRVVAGGERFTFGGREVTCLHTPGHTLDMINFHLPGPGLLFSGDTLFTLGCGRLFEGTPGQMYESLATLRALPGDTRVYGAHEYTMANGRFALHVDGGNAALRTRMDALGRLRARGAPTVPTSLAEECATNPFLRWDDPAIRAGLGAEGAPDAEVFAMLRRAKDAF
ncbi:MAG: hydroxyacylglutathione hydrolase [Shimia sp.]